MSTSSRTVLTETPDETVAQLKLSISRLNTENESLKSKNADLNKFCSDKTNNNLIDKNECADQIRSNDIVYLNNARQIDMYKRRLRNMGATLDGGNKRKTTKGRRKNKSRRNRKSRR